MSEWNDLSIPRSTAGHTGITAHPTRYDWASGYIFFYPTSNLTDTFYIYGFAKPKNIMASTNFMQQFPVNYRPAAIALATSYLAARLKRWTEAEYWRTEFDRQVGILKGVEVGSVGEK